MNKPVFHPGNYIEDIIEAQKITQEEFAKRIGISGKEVSKLLNKKRNLNFNLANKLASAFGMSSEVWMNIQAQYDAYQESLRETERLEEEKPCLEALDYQFFIREDVVDYARSWKDKVKNLRRALKVSSLKNLEHSDLLTLNRIATTKIPNHTILARNAWATVGFEKAMGIDATAFDRQKLLNLLPDIKPLTKNPSQKVLTPLQDKLRECGVRFVFLSHLKNANVSGATKWLRDKSVIVLVNDYRKYTDTFWFSFFHEMGHIIHDHGKTLHFTEKKDCLEDEADRFAKDFLITPDAFKAFIESNDYSQPAILALAEREGIHPGIVVGRLQKEGIISYQALNHLREQFEDC